MEVPQSPALVVILQKTLEKVEQSSALPPQDPALQELRRRVLLLIATLEGKDSAAA